MVTIEFEITDDQYELLKQLDKKGWMEYRDRYGNIEKFKKDNPDFTDETVNRFLSRNNNGTQDLMWDLSAYGLVDTDEDSYHTTFKVTKFGKDSLKRLERNISIDSILDK